MNKTIFKNWAELVKPEDSVWHLGDFCYGDYEETEQIVDRFNALPGKKYLVPGNHDEKRISQFARAFEIRPELCETEIRDIQKTAVLCNFSLATWHNSHRGYIMLHGHCHGNFQSQFATCVDVGVDAWNFAPAAAKDIARKIRDDFRAAKDDPASLPRKW